MEKIKWIFESEKDIEALKLEAKNSKFAVKAIVAIYAIFAAIIGGLCFFEPICDWIESKTKSSKSDDLDD